MSKNKNNVAWRGALVSGMGAGKDFWPLLLPAAELAPAGRWQILSAGEHNWRFADEVTQLRAGLAALPHDGTPLVLAGHSYGAQHVIALAQQYREQNLPLAGVVLLAPALGRWWLAEASWRFTAWLMQGRPLPEIFLSTTERANLTDWQQQLPAKLLRDNQLPQLWGAASQSGMGFDWQDLVALNVPVLVVGPRGDQVVPLALPGAALPAQVTVQQPGAEHGHFLFMHAPETWQQIAAWVAALTA